MSSAGEGEPEGVETPGWLEFKSAWNDSAAVRKIDTVVVDLLANALDGVDNDAIERIVAEVIGFLASDLPRCIHEDHPGPGYRAEWKHWVANHLQHLKGERRARFDRNSRRWFGSGLETIRFAPGEIYKRRELHSQLGGQERGGISTPKTIPLILLFTGEEGHQYGYTDGLQTDGTYRYFGEGQAGDMEMTRGNLAIRDHSATGRDVHLFESLGNGMVKYLGQMVCAGVEYLDGVPDREGQPRRAIAFRLAPIDRFEEHEEQKEESGGGGVGQAPYDRAWFWTPPLEDLRRLADQAPETTEGPASGTRKVYHRSEAVKVWVQRRAGGKCEACGVPAPFTTVDGRPYLEPHHTRRLSDGGPDNREWVVAVCPNCHRRAHYSQDRKKFNDDLKALANRLERSGP